MNKLSVAHIGTLEQYLALRPVIRQAIIEHKRSRRVALGPNATLHFEDSLTMKYQVQEMMRAENLRDEATVSAEIEAYNPMIPDGSNLKCTLMLEYSDPQERQQRLRELVGIETSIFIQIGQFAPVAPVADEDIERSTPEKTSAVHFLRYEFTPEMIDAAKSGAKWAIYSNHPQYLHRLSPLPEDVTKSLCRDFD